MSVKYYFINLERSKNRLEKFNKEISFHPDIKFIRFNAIEGRQNDHNISPGSYGCAMSHYGVLEDFLNSTASYAVIFEDDIIMTCDFSERIDYLTTQIKERWGIIWLGQTLNNHNWGGRPQPIIYEYSEDLLECSFPLGAFGYIVNREGARAILKGKKTRFTFYDVELIKCCENNQWKKLILKKPIVYANVWSSSTIESRNLINLHELSDISLYRRDFEINNLMDNVELIKYFNVEHLFIGRPSKDLTDETIMSIFNKFKEEKNPEILKPLLTYKQNIVTTFQGLCDIEYFGRSLYFLRFAPVKIYIENLDQIEKIPKLPYNKYILGKKKIKSNELFIRMAKYHYLKRWDLMNEYKDITFTGHRCFEYPVKNYFYNGNANKTIINPSILTEVSYLGNKINEKFNFIRSIDFDGNLLFELAKLLNYPLNEKTIAFTNYLDSRYNNSKARVISKEDFPDVLIYQNDIIPQIGKYNILDITQPIDFDPVKFDLVINSIKRINKAPNEIWIPLFLRRSHDIKLIETVRKESFDNKRSLKISIQSPHAEIQEKLNIEVVEINIYSQFTVVVEDILHPGYISEKILNAFSNGSVPIYLGPKEIFQFFNEKAFIYIPDYDSFDSLREKLTDETYKEMISHSIWKGEVPFFEVNI